MRARGEHLRAQSAAPATKSALRGSHKALRLPRNLQQSAMDGCHEICISRFTKCCTCHKICTSRFTKRCACHEISKKSAFRGSQSAVPATKSALRCSPIAAVPATATAKSALRGSQSAVPAAKCAFRGSQRTAPATKSASEPHVKRSRHDSRHLSRHQRSSKITTMPKRCTCHEICVSK